jgi:integrase
MAGSLRDQVMLSLGYGCGLRAGEIVRLKDGDIDSAQMIIRIVQSKGRKDPACHAATRVAFLAATVVEGAPDTL